MSRVGVSGRRSRVAQVDVDRRSVEVCEVCRQGERLVVVLGEEVRAIA